MTGQVVISDNKVNDSTIIKRIVEDAGFDIRIVQEESEDELIDVADGAIGMIPDARTSISRELIEAADDLDVIGRGGIGVDNIDLEAAAANDVTVVNVPDYGLDEVSAHALTLSLCCLRKVRVYDKSVRNGQWDWTVGEPIPRLENLTIGLLAFGKIARRHAKKWLGFGVDVVAYDPYVREYRMADLDVEKVTYEELLAQSDILSIHAPLTDETRGMIDMDSLERMKESAILVNTARGPIIDANALYQALDHGEIEAAGLDVLPTEPPTDSPLFDRDDVVLTPHIAWHSTESLEDLSRCVAEDVVRVLQGQQPLSPVSLDDPWL